MKVNFIHVNFNNSLLTIACVQSILSNKYVHKIIIVDNDSSIEEKKILKEWLQKNTMDNDPINVLFLDENLGYFKAINKGIAYLGDLVSVNYTVAGNNDLVFPSDFTEKLFMQQLDNTVFLIAPNIIKSNGVHQNPYLISSYSSMHKRFLRIYYSNYYVASILHKLASILSISKSEVGREGHDTKQFITAGHGSCYIITPAFFCKCTKLDDSSFLFGEELNLAYQVKRQNGKTLYVPDLIVSHNEHSTMNAMSSRKTYGYQQESYRIFSKFIDQL